MWSMRPFESALHCNIETCWQILYGCHVNSFALTHMLSNMCTQNHDLELSVDTDAHKRKKRGTSISAMTDMHTAVLLHDLTCSGSNTKF